MLLLLLLQLLLQARSESSQALLQKVPEMKKYDSCQLLDQSACAPKQLLVSSSTPIFL
jgi:hypothetical protein